MLTVHTLWLLNDHAVVVWGEAVGAPGAASPGLHPQACSHQRLRLALEEAGQACDSAQESHCGLILPSTEAGPLPSGATPGPEAFSWRPWVVPCLVMPSAAALGWLLEIPGQDDAALRWSHASRVMHQAALLCVDQVARGNLVPTLERQGDRWEARWRPTLEGTLPNTLETLARALPVAAGAGAMGQTWASWLQVGQLQGWQSLPAPSRASILYDMVWRLSDDMARAGLVAAPPMKVPSSGGKAARALAAWLQALQAPDGQVQAQGMDPQLQRLQREVLAWSNPLHRHEGARARLCLQLREPEQEDGAWIIEPLLQDVSNPSTLLPLSVAWRRGAAARVLGRLLQDPRGDAQDMARAAAKLAPELAPIEERGQPVQLSLEAAWEFLAQSAPLLQRAGFGVLAPRWWQKNPLALQGQQRAEANAGLAERLFHFDWSVVLGDHPMDEATLEALAELKVPLVQFRGEWVELHAEAARRALTFLRQQQGRALSTIEALRLSSGIDELEGMPVRSLKARGVLAQLLEGGASYQTLRKEPRGFVGQLRPYQKRGLSWMVFLEQAGLGPLLADDMGLGKTVQVLALLEHERTGRGQKRLQPGPTLLICPMSVVGNWEREAARFAPKLRVHLHHGAQRLSQEAFAACAQRADLVITTYATAARDRETLEGVSWRRVALDEAQNIKNTQTKQAKAIKALRAQHHLALTGTPVENRLLELWSLMDFLNPGLLGGRQSFLRSLARPIEESQDGHKAAQLRTLCAPFVLRRLKSDKKIIKDLPGKQEFKTYCTLTREQATLYRATLKDAMESIESSSGMARKGLILATMTRLKQLCDHPALLLKDGSALPGRSGKLRRLEELLLEIADHGEKALVFTQYVEMGHLLQPHLEQTLGLEVLFLHGQVKREDRERLLQHFQSSRGPMVFLISLKAGGTGLTLTAANHVIHFDRWWNPAVEDQATDRAYRIGQQKQVQVRKLISAGTLEESMDDLIDGKRALAEQVIQRGEAGLTELSTEALRRVLSLSDKLVED